MWSLLKMLMNAIRGKNQIDTRIPGSSIKYKSTKRSIPMTKHCSAGYVPRKHCCRPLLTGESRCLFVITAATTVGSEFDSADVGGKIDSIYAGSERVQMGCIAVVVERD